MDLTIQIIIFFFVITVVIWMSIWYIYTPNNKSNFKIIYSVKEYLNGFDEKYLIEDKLDNITNEGTIIFNNDAEYLNKNINLLDNPLIYKCFTSKKIKKKHDKLEIIPKDYLNDKMFTKHIYQCLRDKCVILNFFTGGLADEWRNLLYTLRKLKLEDLIIVFPLDQIAFDAVKKENIKYDISLMKDEPIKTVRFGGANFKHITCNKVLAIKKLLEQGKFVFYLDTDIVVKQNFIQNYFTLPPKHIWMQNDHNNYSKNAVGRNREGKTVYNHCTGVMFIAPTKFMIDIMDQAYPKILEIKDGGLTDQKILNDIIPLSNIGTLCPYDYPNGWRYFISKKTNLNPILIHGNWCRGVQEKIRRFKKYGLWYI